MASLNIENSDNAGKAIKLNLFQMGLSWGDTSFSFDGAPKGLNTVASLALNQVVMFAYFAMKYLRRIVFQLNRCYTSSFA